MSRPFEARSLPFLRLTRSRLARAALVAALALTVIGTGCDIPPPNAPTRPLAAYAGRSLQLFDDAIDPNAVGISLEVGADPRTDRTLRERTQIGDAAVRVRVTTITSKEDEGTTRYVVGVRTLEKLAGQFPPPESFPPRVYKQTCQPQTPSHSIASHSASCRR